MERRKFMSLPKVHRRARSEARSEVGPAEDPMALDPAALHPAQSTPDLGTGPSTLQTSGLRTPDDQGSNGMQFEVARWINRLIVLFPSIQTATSILV